MEFVTADFSRFLGADVKICLSDDRLGSRDQIQVCKENSLNFLRS